MPIVIPSGFEEEAGLPQMLYETLDPTFDVYDTCQDTSVDCGQSMPNTPLQQYMYSCPTESVAMPTFAPYPSYLDNLSPAPIDPIVDHTHKSHRGRYERKVSRAPSFTSSASSWSSCRHSELSRSDFSRSASPNASEMSKWGQQQDSGIWRCAYPGCTSRSVFRRGCDLRKHYRRHTKSLFCRYPDCKQSNKSGFSSEKDRARHEAKHDPQISCEWEDCKRVFSRVDNMVSHPFDHYQSAIANGTCSAIMSGAYTTGSKRSENDVD